VCGTSFGGEGPELGEVPPIRIDSFRDFQLVQKVRDVLREDTQLALMKLFVRVKDRVAILEGEVATEAQLREAVKRIETVSGIAVVRTDLVRVVKPKHEDVLVIPLLQDEPPSRTEARFSERITSVIGRPTALPRREDAVPEVIAVRLEAPIPVPTIPEAEPVTTLRATVPLTVDVVSAAIERARQRNGRFRLLDVEARGDFVWVRGTVDQLDTGMELARALTDLGVRHVVIQCTSPR
jgi:hypothetical protein